jgi:hypothetical protein
MQRRWGALIEGPARARSRGSRRRKPTTMLPFWSRGCHARNPASGGYRARLRGALRPRGCSLCGCRSARKHQPSSHPHFGHGVGAAAGGATSGGGGEPHVRHEATRVHHAARRCGGRVAACGACAADRPGASSEMLRVECARACDDKFATRDGPVWLYSASRLRARLACPRRQSCARSVLFQSPRYNSADHDRCPRCRQSLVRDLYPTKLYLCHVRAMPSPGVSEVPCLSVGYQRET